MSWLKNGDNMIGDDAFEIGDMRFHKSEGSTIQKIEDFRRLNKKIEIKIKLYRLDGLLLKIHETSLKYEDTKNINRDFLAGSITKYALLNCSIQSGFTPIYDDEFDELSRIIEECTIYDPEYEKERKFGVNQEERLDSLLLRKFGSQARWDIRPRYMFGRTLFLYDEMVKNEDAPAFIKELVNSKFEEEFGLSLIDFIKIGFLLFAGSKNLGGMTREYFEIARKQNIPIANDKIVKKCLEHVACDPRRFKKICREQESKGEDLHAYKLNPLFEYPMVRPWSGSNQDKPKEDKFIAPVPNLVLYRFTTGLYYQLFNTFREDFSTAFGELFEKYVGKLLEWCKLQEKVFTEGDIKTYLSRYNGKKPDYVVFCDDGVVLIESKATKYTQDMYEHGLKAEAKACISQVAKAINQMNEFETQIPSLSKACGFNYTNLKIQKVIVTFENLIGLQDRPLRNEINRKLKAKRKRGDWKILWVWYLEEAQPYIAKGVDFWSFLKDYDKRPFCEIGEDLRSKIGVSYSDGALSKYEKRVFDELTRNGEIFKKHDCNLGS